MGGDAEALDVIKEDEEASTKDEEGSREEEY